MSKYKLSENYRTNIFFLVCVSFSTLISITAVLGWVFIIPELASFGSQIIPMALSTALLFFIFGLVIFLIRKNIKKYNALTVSLTLFALLIALIIFFLSSNGIYLPVESSLIKNRLNLTGTLVGHMSPLTAFCFVLIGAVLLIRHLFYSKKIIFAGFILSLIIILICFVLILSYIFGTPLLYGGNFIPPALPTSLSMLCLGLALVFLLGQNIFFLKNISATLNTRFTYVLALVFVFLFVSIITAAYSYFKSYEKQMLGNINHQLTSISSLKINEILQWRKERIGNAILFYKNINFSMMVNRYFQNPRDNNSALEISDLLMKIKDAYSYDLIRLYDINYKVRIAYPDTIGQHSSSYIKHISEVLKTKQITLTDFYRNEFDKRIYLNLYVPVFDLAKNKITAILSLRIDPEKYLYPLINTWPTPSKTAETLILKHEGNDAIFLNELRFKKKYCS